jgi:hypothetical protein
VVVGHVALVDVDVEVGKCLEQIIVVAANAVAAIVVLINRLVLVPRILSERRHDAGEVVLILLADVFFHEFQALLTRCS